MVSPARRTATLAMAVLGAAALAGSCGGGDGGGGQPAIVEIESPDPRCVALPDPFGFPPGYAFVPDWDGRVLTGTFTQPTLVPLDVRRVPFRVPARARTTPIPSDADGDGCPEFVQPVDDVIAFARDLAGVTLSGYEAVVFADPAGGMREVVLETPPTPSDPGFDRTTAIDPEELLFWPDPGTSAVRTGVPNFTCIVPRPGAVDSRGDPIGSEAPVTQTCPARRTSTCPQDRASYRASFTAGAAISSGRLFTAVSNLGAGRGGTDTQFLPAALTVYAFDAAGARPRIRPIATPDGGAFLLGSEGAFNYTHVQAWTTPGGRPLLLATASGPIGIREDDPDTDEFESGAVRLGDGAIDVFDPLALQLVATYPLRGANPAFHGVAIDPSGRLAAVGDVTAPWVYVVDLAPLDALPQPPVPGAPPAVLRGADVLFDGRNPLEVPRLPNGAPEATCPGRVDSVAWNDAGDRLYALEVCDGTLTAFGWLDPGGAPSPGDFARGPTVAVTAPLRADTIGTPRFPARLALRPGRPGVDYDGPDAFFLVNEPEALLCGIAIESP